MLGTMGGLFLTTVCLFLNDHNDSEEAICGLLTNDDLEVEMLNHSDSS